jgi:hypothetical protein
MSGDWLKMEVGLPEKPEVWQIAGIVGIDADSVVGKLLKVWRWFDAHTENGNAVGVTYPLVDHVAGVSGFAEAMALCGWLVQDGSILSIPHFDRHNGKTAKNRALTAKRVAKCKENSNARGNEDTVTSALPREEKRREEQKTLSASADAVDENSTTGKGDEPRRLIPVTAILAAYHASLPMLPAVRQMTDSRKKKLKQRWLEDAECQSVEYWAKFFAYVAQSDFLTGRDGRWTGCNFEWLIEAKNHLKVIEGTYENREAA